MGKYYKWFLAFCVLAIFYFSKTSGILVLEPSTWFNGGEYSPDVYIKDVLDKSSSFHWGYLENGRSFDELTLEFYLRKVLHAVFYATLTFLFIKSFPKHFILAPLFSLSIAFLDELNQYLLIGRSGRMADVALDFTASLLVVFVYFSLYLRKEKRIFIKNKKVS